MNIAEAISFCRQNAPKRKFTQTFDLSINVKGIDMKKPESKFTKEIVLPHGSGKENRICVISDNVKNFPNIVGKADVESMEQDKKYAKRFVREYDWFLAEAPMMTLVGRVLGKYLGPVGRMPKLLPPNADANAMAKGLGNAVRIRLKDSPVLHCPVGTEEMSDEQIAANMSTVIEDAKKAMPGKAQIKNAYLKLTMGKAAKIEVK